MNKKADPFEYEFQNELTSKSIWNLNNYLVLENSRKLDIAAQTAKSCCFPCIILGQLNSLVYREDSKYSCEMGDIGLNTCAITSMFCILGWPFSPLLALYTCKQRDNLQKLHKSRNPCFASKENPSTWDHIKEFNSVCCLWPCAIIEQEYHMKHLNAIGLLPFHWEYDLIHTSIPNPPISDCYTAMIIGSNHCGKSTLFQKLLHTSIPALQNQIERTIPDEKLRIGIRNTKVSKDKISFIEIWDIPTNNIIQLPINFIHHTCEHVLYNTIPLEKTLIFLSFDVSSLTSWNELLHLYNLLEKVLQSKIITHQIVLLMLKYDLITELAEQMIQDYKPIYERRVINNNMNNNMNNNVEPDGHVEEVEEEDPFLIKDIHQKRTLLEYSLANEIVNENQSSSISLNPMQDTLKQYYEALLWSQQVNIPIIKISSHQYNYGIKNLYSYILDMTT